MILNKNEKINLLKYLNKIIHAKELYQYIKEVQTNNNIYDSINSNRKNNENLFRYIEYKNALEDLKEGKNLEKYLNDLGITEIN